MTRTCWCPPWHLRSPGLRAPLRWMPLAFLRWYHRVSDHNCTKRYQAEHDEYVDFNGRYQIHDRMVAVAYHTAKQYAALYWELKKELNELKKGDNQ